ncbi:MAG: plasmid mobilization relaxosome protein MobC [Oscillospiraceae bacterium]|nr:plasmid mobilization relaxosome protein MobC [Oscillospiraceae bacterium]
MTFWASEEEYARIRKRMSAANCQNLSAFLRNTAIHGYIVNIYEPNLKKILSLFHCLSVNPNQIAKRVNESGRIYGVDVQEILSGQKEIEGQLRQILEAFNNAV